MRILSSRPTNRLPREQEAAARGAERSASRGPILPTLMTAPAIRSCECLAQGQSYGRDPLSGIVESVKPQ